MGSSGCKVTAGGSPELPDPRLLTTGNRRLHNASLLGAGMSPNSSMRALQCIKTAGELGGFRENSEGTSHPLTLHTSLIAATSTGFTLWPSRHPMVLISPATYPNRSPPDPPRTLRIVCNADALTLPISSPVHPKSRKTTGEPIATLRQAGQNSMVLWAYLAFHSSP